jgi:hypothetical protein
MMATEDIDVINYFIIDRRFGEVTVSFIEIIVHLKEAIDRAMILDIESVTDKDYYFHSQNSRLVIPRIKDAANRKI